MQKLYISLVIILSLFYIFAFSFTINYFENSFTFNEVVNNSGIVKDKKPDYHFVVIADDIDDPFWLMVKEGAFKAAKEHNVTVEFTGPKFSDAKEEARYMEIAIDSRVDGIATYVPDESLFSKLIDKSWERGIPVVTVQTDTTLGKRFAFIGSSSFKEGFEWGRLTAEATKHKAMVAVIQGNFTSVGGNILQNIKIGGFRESVKSIKGINIKTIQMLKAPDKSVEDIVRHTIGNHPDINVLLCTGEIETIAAAQVVVDLGLTGSVFVIGVGNSPEILDFIKKGVIYGTVVSNPEKMGYESIKALIGKKKNVIISSYVDTGVSVVTKEYLLDNH